MPRLSVLLLPSRVGFCAAKSFHHGIKAAKCIAVPQMVPSQRWDFENSSVHLQCEDFYCLRSPGISLSIRCECIKSVAFGLVRNVCVVQMRKCRRSSALPVTAQQGNGRLEIRALDSVLCFGWWRHIL